MLILKLLDVRGVEESGSPSVVEEGVDMKRNNSGGSDLLDCN